MRDSTRRKHRISVREILAYVRDHPDRDLSLGALGQRVFTSPFHFQRIFKELTCRTPRDHAREIRLRLAAWLLTPSEGSIGRIAWQCGYRTHEAFTRAFRSRFGSSPSDFRKKEPSMDVKIGLVKIPVRQFAKACAFYRETLGLREEFAVEAYGWAQYQTTNVPLCLYVTGQGGGSGTPGGETGIHLSVQDPAAARERFRDRGADVGNLLKGDDGLMFFDLQDPDGNVIKVGQG